MDYRMLIDRFFQGVTTPEEDQELRRCLLSDDMPAEIRAEKELLLAMLEPAEYDCSEAMAEVSAMVDSLATQEPASVPGKRTFRVVMLRYLTPAVAAAAVLLFMFRIGLSEPELRIDNTRCGQMAYVGNQDTYTAPEEVARHIDDLFSMFAAATADGLNEQKEHLRQFAVLNEMFK